MRAKEFITESENLFPKVIEDILRVVPEAKEIWFHGSRATGKHRSNSDWDILVIVDKNLLKDRDYFDVVMALKPLNAKYKKFDIQAGGLPTYEGSVVYWAREEGILLWKDSNVAESASGYIPSEKEKNDPTYNVNEVSGYIPSNAQKNDPRFSSALTKDVRPDSIQKNAKAFGFKTTRAGIPPLLRK